MTTFHSKSSSDRIRRATLVGSRLTVHVPPSTDTRHLASEMARRYPQLDIVFLHDRTSSAAMSRRAPTRPQMQTMAMETKEEKKSVSWQDYVGLIVPLTSPVNLFVRRKDVSSGADKIHVIFYSIGEKKILVGGTYEKKSKALTFDCSCNYRRATELSDQIRIWQKKDFAIVGSFAKNRPRTKMADFTSVLGRRATPDEYLMAYLLAKKPARWTTYEQARVEEQPELWKRWQAMPSTTWDLVVTQYQTLARDAMTDDEYKRSKAWIAWVDEPATSPQKERLFEVAEANSDALLHEFYVLQRTTPEDKELNPDDYQQQMAVFNNELRTRIAAYEKGVNLSGIYARDATTAEVQKAVLDAVAAFRFYEDKDRPACSSELECETGATGEDDATCYFWNPVPPPSVEDSLI